MMRDTLLDRFAYRIVNKSSQLGLYYNVFHRNLESFYFKTLFNDSSSDYLKKEFPVELPGSFSPVFALSTGRCGTLMLTKLLSLSSSIQAYHEPDPKLVLESFLYYNRQLYFKKNPELWADLIKYARHNLMLRAHWLNRIYFESNNRLSLITDLLNSIFPNAKYIHIVRHPFDFVRSAINRGYYYDNSWDFARIRPKANDVMHASWSNTKRIEKCAWLWNATNQHIVYFLKKIPSENKMTLKAENLFSSDYKVISRIFNFISNGIRPPSKKIIDKKLKKK